MLSNLRILSVSMIENNPVILPTTHCKADVGKGNLPHASFSSGIFHVLETMAYLRI